MQEKSNIKERKKKSEGEKEGVSIWGSESGLESDTGKPGVKL